MHVLVLYGTSEGQTRKIGEHVADQLHALGMDVTVADCAAAATTVDLYDFDAVLLAARVHAGRHHRAIVAFARRNHQLLRSMNSAFLSVSMAAAGRTKDDMERMAGYKRKFSEQTGWEPGAYHDVAGARRYTQHNWLTRLILGWIDGNQYDRGTDHEFTDWPDLDKFVEGWARKLMQTPAGGHDLHRPSVG